MSNVVAWRPFVQSVAACLALAVFINVPLRAEDFKPVEVPNAGAKSEQEMKPYTDVITGTKVTFDMVPIHGGDFLMGSPPSEKDRKEDEGPQVKVKVDPFWMGKCEVSWDEYDIWSFSLDVHARKVNKQDPHPLDKLADIVTRPTKPYTDMTFDMGHSGYPAICMTHHAAVMYTKWLSAKTGRYYRLPTEAEWEYACRAGSTTAYSFGDDPSKLDDYAWSYDNSDEKYQKVGKKKPNPWGLYDMHGNVWEFTLDQYTPDYFKKLKGNPADNPLMAITKEYPVSVRGGSWDDDPDRLRSAARRGSDPSWKVQDPQIPKSIWYFTDALFAGFRIVRPLKEPPGWHDALIKEMEEAAKHPRDRQ